VDFEGYSRSEFAVYAALADTVASILRAAIDAYPHALRLQQVQQRPKSLDSLRKKLENRGILDTTKLENEIKDLAGCRLIFYTNSDVSNFLRSGIIQDNFEVDWDRTKIYHPSPEQTATENLFISNNYVLKLKADRTALPEYVRFDGLWCEVQVQTTLNHAWSEMEHDIIYKKPTLQGFGAKLFEAIEQRLQKIMKTHLLPAGYEFQKVLDDHERLLNGKELLDRGALKALSKCTDNNTRHELLERFRDYVLPNYDDPRSVYPEIKEQLVAAVVAARLTKPRPIETPFGNLPGITAEGVVEVASDILTNFRYVDIEITFDAVCELFPGTQTEKERKHLLNVAERLAQHNLDVWKQVGPYVQTVLVQKIRQLDRVSWNTIRPVLIEVLGEVLKSEVHGTSSTYKTVTFHQSSAVASDALMRMRSEGIELLKELYRTASSEIEKRCAESAMFEAARAPSNGRASNELLRNIKENAAIVVDFFAEIATTESYEMLQTTEYKLFWMYRNNQGVAGAQELDAALLKARDALTASILKFRDVVNANRGFVVFKTLVGFESIFPPAWDNPEFDVREEASYREQRIDELVAGINEQNAEEWFTTIRRCAQTRSDDLATFPSFGQFLQKMSETKPKIVLGFIDRLDEPLTGFLGVILSGLARSDGHMALDAKMAEWLNQEKYLVEMAHYVQFAPKFDPVLLQKVLALGIKRRNDPVVVQVMASFARRYSEVPQGLIEGIFLPAIKYFTERRDARWINLVWFIPKERSPLIQLSAEQIDVVLKSLLYAPNIETHAEWVLRLLAEQRAESVFDFFGGRLRYSDAYDGEGKHEALPFQFYELHKSFVRIADHAVDTVRQWFASADGMFQFQAGHLLAISFPDYGQAFRGKLHSCVQSGNRNDIEFVVRVMSSYDGESFLNETCKTVVQALPIDDPLLENVEIILQSTGAVSGELGLVHAYTAKKQEVADWLVDPDSKVRAFADSYIRLLDRLAAAEQRRSEEDIEMRKRRYGES
jgi:ppGpp synthetase/RelA/SpoT-type nucleotidyltranferase